MKKGIITVEQHKELGKLLKEVTMQLIRYGVGTIAATHSKKLESRLMQVLKNLTELRSDLEENMLQNDPNVEDATHVYFGESLELTKKSNPSDLIEKLSQMGINPEYLEKKYGPQDWERQEINK